MIVNCVFLLFMYYRKEKNGDLFREEENGLGVVMRDQGEGGKEPVEKILHQKLTTTKGMAGTEKMIDTLEEALGTV